MDTNGDLKDIGKPRKGGRPLSAMDRTIQAAVSDERTLGNEEDPARESMPNLWEWLTRTKASRDHVITPGKLVITACPGGWIIQLNHADLAQSFEASSIDLGGCIAAMEVWLASPQCIPKSWGKKQPTARRRKPIQ